jgi:phosphoribosylaminoimidazolecarboxamide formyltransferase / IMP cyclohydrolase
MNFVEKIDDNVKIERVLVSVYDKEGLYSLVPQLLRINPEIVLYSTGGTYRAIADILGDAKVNRLAAVSEYTGQPEMQGGLVKTLDFKIYLGLLSETYNPAHRQDLDRTGAVAIDMVVVNLYPFQDTVARRDVTPERARANIDIGGPCMIRAAAKNFLRVAAVVDPGDYGELIAELDRNEGRLSLATRFRLAQKTFAYTSEYDSAIAGYLGSCDHAEVRSSYPEVLA